MPKPLLQSDRSKLLPVSRIYQNPPNISKYLNIAPSLQERYNEHVRSWKLRLMLARNGDYVGRTVGACTKCGLCSRRRNVVLFRGNLPCDVLFIGEAPGESEDMIGVPFVGPAGNQLAKMWTAACAYIGEGSSPNYGITNIVGCIPRTPSDIGTGEIRTPHKEEAAACQPRLLEILALASPQKIVLLGDIAKRFFPKVINAKLPRWDGKLVCLPHPARILHLLDESPNAATLMEKKFIISLSSILKEVGCAESPKAS